MCCLSHDLVEAVVPMLGNLVGRQTRFCPSMGTDKLKANKDNRQAIKPGQGTDVD